MKKIRVFLVIMVMMISFLIPINNAKAKTLQDLYNQLDGLKKKKQDADNGVKLSEEQIRQINNDIVNINKNIEKAGNDIIAAEDKIEKTELDIKQKEEEIKKIMNYVQVSNGESAYLEYVYGAKDFSDFIYRAAVAEQMVNYNKKLVQEYNDLIISLEKKKEDLAKKQKNLEAQKVTLGDKIDTLRSQAAGYEEEGATIEDEIKMLQTSINYYKGLNCKPNQDLSTCDKVAYADGWVYPLKRGMVTSNYGSRWGTVHRGIDLAGVPAGTPIYPAAPGRVAASIYSVSGGNMVYIYHTVKGKKYTTIYMHMTVRKVSAGQTVDVNTVIGTVGNTGNSQGAHLHFTMATGWEVAGYHAHTFDPRKLIKFPPEYGGWFSR